LPVESSSARSSERLKLGLICLFLIVISWIVYGQILGHDFINYDDEQYVTENAHVLNGLNWADLKWAFTTGHTGYSHPITWLSIQLDTQLYGKWAGGHHLTSLIIHSINAVLVFLLFWRMTGEVWPSGFVAAIFAIHPLHVESVAWVAERKDVLSGLFFLLTLHGYVSYVAKRGAGRYLVAVGLFILGILSKPMLVTVPCVLLLLDYWPLRRNELCGRQGGCRSIGVGKDPVRHRGGVVESPDFYYSKADRSGSRGSTFCVGAAVGKRGCKLRHVYLEHDLAAKLGVVLSLPNDDRDGGRAAFGNRACIDFDFLHREEAIVTLSNRRLVVVCGDVGASDRFYPSRKQARADRYTYLPQIGLCLLVVWGVVELLRWRGSRQVLAVIGTFLITGLTALAYVQASYWQNSETVWNHSLAHTAENYVAHNNLGKAVMLKGRLDEAVVHFRRALEICDECSDVHNNLGHALARKGNWAEAVPAYQSAIRTWPTGPNAHNNNNLGIALARIGRSEEAIEQFREALRLDGTYREAHSNLALVLLQLGRRDEAVQHLKEALRLKPDDPQVKAQLKQLGVE
jgi:tetratricopeptide (TPR) repeat protein